MVDPSLLLLALLRDAETPLYSAYRFMQRQETRDLSLQEFLLEVESLLAGGIVQLWHLSGGDRRELHSIAPGLASAYEAVRELDESYDPLGHTLTLGPNAPNFGPAPWTFDADFHVGTFVWEGPAAVADDVLGGIRAVHPQYELDVQQRESGGDLVRLSGRIVKR